MKSLRQALSGQRPRGFTLTELVAVIVVLGILSAVAAPRLMQRDAFDQMGVADQLRGALRHAQRVAVARNREVCVTVATNGVTFQVAQAAGAGAACTQPLDQGNGDPLLLAIPAQTGLTLTPEFRFRFTPDGRLRDEGVPLLQRPAQPISLRSGGVNTTTLTLQTDNGYLHTP